MRGEMKEDTTKVKDKRKKIKNYNEININYKGWKKIMRKYK
jgi:hypothetical protein